MKKLFCVLCCCLLFLGAFSLSSYADDASSTPVPSSDPAGQLGQDIGGAVDDYGDGLFNGIDTIQNGWDEFSTGIAAMCAFFGGTVGGILTLLPSVKFIIILAALLVSLRAIISMLRS